MPKRYNQAGFKIDEEKVVQLRLKISTLLAAINQAVAAASSVNSSVAGGNGDFHTRVAANKRLYAQGVPLTSERLGPILSRDTEEVYVAVVLVAVLLFFFSCFSLFFSSSPLLYLSFQRIHLGKEVHGMQCRYTHHNPSTAAAFAILPCLYFLFAIFILCVWFF